MQPVLLNQNSPAALANQTDFVEIELRNPLFPHNIAFNAYGVLQTDGNLTVTFPNAAIGNSYYICVHHRNSIETWSANPILIAPFMQYDFTDVASKAFGANQIQVEPNIWAFFSGDINQDQNVDLLDLSVQEEDINNFLFGYFATDINGDGNVDLLDAPILENNITGFVFSAHP